MANEIDNEKPVDTYVQRDKSLTTSDLIKILLKYPPDTPVLNGQGFDLHVSSITEMKLDDWSTSTVEEDADGHKWETPGVAIGVSIGPRF